MFIFLIIVIIALSWYIQPYQPMERAKRVFNKTTQSIFVIEKNWLVFKPIDKDINTGLIIYPGAKVEPKAYSPLAYDIAQSGYLVLIVPMLLNLAVLGVDKADGVIKKYSNINN